MNSLAARVLSYVGEPTVLSFLFCGAYLRHLEPVACLSDQVVVDDTDGLGLGAILGRSGMRKKLRSPPRGKGQEDAA